MAAHEWYYFEPNVLWIPKDSTEDGKVDNRLGKKVLLTLSQLQVSFSRQFRAGGMTSHKHDLATKTV